MSTFQLFWLTKWKRYFWVFSKENESCVFQLIHVSTLQLLFFLSKVEKMLSVARTKEFDFRRSKVSIFDECIISRTLWEHPVAAVPWQQPVLLSVTSGEEENWDMMCQRAEQAASGTDMGLLCNLGATKWRNRVFPGQLRDGGERGFLMFWKGDGRECSTAASWACERENEGGKVETRAVRQGRGCQGCVCSTYLIPTHTPATGTLGQGMSIRCWPFSPPQGMALPHPHAFCDQKFIPSEGQASARDCRFGENWFSKNTANTYDLIPGGSAVASLSKFGHFLLYLVFKR